MRMSERDHSQCFARGLIDFFFLATRKVDWVSLLSHVFLFFVSSYKASNTKIWRLVRTVWLEEAEVDE